MSKGTIIKAVLVSGSLCAALYQAAQFMDVLSSAKGQQAMNRPQAGGGAAGLQAMINGAGGAAPGAQDLLKQLGGMGAVTETPATKEVVVFSPDGKKLTPEQQEALRKQAERNRPRVPANKPRVADK